MKRSVNPVLKVLFNASVVLSGLRSPQGGSGILLSHVAKRTIRGIISETILDEVVRNAHKSGMTNEEATGHCYNLFSPILPAPSVAAVRHHKTIVADLNDAHLFATYEEAQCDYLVSLDKYHVLSLQGKLKEFTILAPGDLINVLQKQR